MKNESVSRIDVVRMFDDVIENQDSECAQLSSEIIALQSQDEYLKEQISKLESQRGKVVDAIAKKRQKIFFRRAYLGRLDELTREDQRYALCRLLRSWYSIDEFCELYFYRLDKGSRPTSDEEQAQFDEMMEEREEAREELKTSLLWAVSLFEGQYSMGFYDERFTHRDPDEPLDMSQAERDVFFSWEAYRDQCRRLGMNLNVPIFTLRDRLTIDDVRRAYEELPEVQSAKQVGQNAVSVLKKKIERPIKQRLEERDDVENIVGSVFREMPHATEDDKNYEISKRAHISIDQAKRWKKAYRSNHPRKPLN